MSDFQELDDEPIESIEGLEGLLDLSVDFSGESNESLSEDFDDEFDDFEMDLSVEREHTISDDIELDALDLKTAYAEEQAGDISYPALLLDGVTTEEEFMFLKKRPFDESVALPLYCLVEGVPVYLCYFDLTLQNVLQLRFLSKSYKLYIMRSANDRAFVDINDPNVLFKFIRL